MWKKDGEHHTQQLALRSTMAATYQQLGSLLILPMLPFQWKEHTDHGLHCNIRKSKHYSKLPVKEELAGLFRTCKLARDTPSRWTSCDSSALLQYHECSLFLQYTVPMIQLSFSEIVPKEEKVSADFSLVLPQAPIMEDLIITDSTGLAWIAALTPSSSSQRVASSSLYKNMEILNGMGINHHSCPKMN